MAAILSRGIWVNQTNNDLRFQTPCGITRPQLLSHVEMIFKSLWPSDATLNRVNLVSVNGLLPDGTKTSPELKLTYIIKKCFEAFTCELINLISNVLHYTSIIFMSPRGKWVNISGRNLFGQNINFLLQQTEYPSPAMLSYHTGLILGLRPANERQFYFVTTSLVSWAQT